METVNILPTFVDISDNVSENGDLILTTSKEFKAYNLLKRSFIGYPEIYLDYNEFFDNQIDNENVARFINDYLKDFNALANEVSTTYNKKDGEYKIYTKYKGEEIKYNYDEFETYIF